MFQDGGSALATNESVTRRARPSLGRRMTTGSGFHGLLRPSAHGQLESFVTSSQPGPHAAVASGWLAASREDNQVSDRCPAGRLYVACHGEIYNASDLSRQLGLPPDTPLPRVVIAAWERWSLDFLPRLNGVFALALRDGEELLLYRDPSGLRNLFHFTGRSGQIAFATHLDTLLSQPEVERRLARRSLHEYLRFLDIAAPNTLFEDVIAVEAGQSVHWSARGIETRSWPASDAGTTSPSSFSDAVETLDSYLQRSVQTRLAGSHRPAAFLSGGIDSALLCALATRHRSDVTAITVGFEGAVYDEAPVAQRIAAHLGMKHEVLRFSRQEYLSAFERFSQCAEQPMADPAALATVLAFEHCRGRFDTVIDGTGADEAAGIMPPRHVRLAVGYASRLPRTVRNKLTRLLRRVPGLSGYAPIGDFEHPADTMIRWHGFTRPEIADLCGEAVSFADTHFYRTFDRYPRHAHFERYSALINAMPCERLNQALLISGLPVRFPFCDAEVDRFIRQLRIDYRYLPGEPKRILRSLLARYVPAQIWDIPKHGFNFPLHEFLAAEDFLLVRRHLDADRWCRSGILPPENVLQYARRFMAGDRALTFRVWALVVLGAWLQKHDELC